MFCFVLYYGCAISDFTNYSDVIFFFFYDQCVSQAYNFIVRGVRMVCVVWNCFNNNELWKDVSAVLLFEIYWCRFRGVSERQGQFLWKHGDTLQPRIKCYKVNCVGIICHTDKISKLPQEVYNSLTSLDFFSLKMRYHLGFSLWLTWTPLFWMIVLPIRINKCQNKESKIKYLVCIYFSKGVKDHLMLS